MGQMKYLSDRWADLIRTDHARDTRTPDEIALDIITRAGLTPADGEEAETGEFV